MPILQTLRNNKKKCIAGLAGLTILVFGVPRTAEGVWIGFKECMKFVWNGAYGTVENYNAPQFLTVDYEDKSMTVQVPAEYEPALKKCLDTYKGTPESVFKALKAADEKDGSIDGIINADGAAMLELRLMGDDRDNKLRYNFKSSK